MKYKNQQVQPKAKTNILTQGSKVELPFTLQEKERQTKKVKDQDTENNQSILNSFCKRYGTENIECK